MSHARRVESSSKSRRKPGIASELMLDVRLLYKVAVKVWCGRMRHLVFWQIKRTFWKYLLSSPAQLFCSLHDVGYRSFETSTRSYWAAWRNFPQVSIFPTKPVHSSLTCACEVYLPLYCMFQVVSLLPIFQPKLCTLYFCFHIYAY